MKVSAQYAEDHFREILATAARGEEIDIASEGQQAFRLYLVPREESKKRNGPIVLGAGMGELIVPDDEQWLAMKAEDAEYWENHNLMTSGEI